MNDGPKMPVPEIPGIAKAMEILMSEPYWEGVYDILVAHFRAADDKDSRTTFVWCAINRSPMEYRIGLGKIYREWDGRLRVSIHPDDLVGVPAEIAERKGQETSCNEALAQWVKERLVSVLDEDRGGPS